MKEEKMIFEVDETIEEHKEAVKSMEDFDWLNVCVINLMDKDVIFKQLKDEAELRKTAEAIYKIYELIDLWQEWYESIGTPRSNARDFFSGSEGLRENIVSFVIAIYTWFNHRDTIEEWSICEAISDSFDDFFDGVNMHDVLALTNISEDK